MKKLFIALVAIFTFAVAGVAQTKTYVQANVSTSNRVLYESLEVGATTGKNRLAVVAESFNDRNNFSFARGREYFGGIKYTRGLSVGKRLDFLMLASAMMHIDKDLALFVEPGFGLGFNVSKTVGIIGSVTSPILQNTTPFKTTQLKANVGVQIKL